MNRSMNTPNLDGFLTLSLNTPQVQGVMLAQTNNYHNDYLFDSLSKLGRLEKPYNLYDQTGFSGKKVLENVLINASTQCGAPWFDGYARPPNYKLQIFDCATSSDIASALINNNKNDLVLNLTEKIYTFDKPMVIQGNVILTSSQSAPIQFLHSKSYVAPFIYLEGNGSLEIKDLVLDLSTLKNTFFISTDTTGSSNHTAFLMTGCSIKGLNGSFFRAAKTSVADSIIITNNLFQNTNGTMFVFDEEDDKKGYYNVENLRISFNKFFKS